MIQIKYMVRYYRIIDGLNFDNILLSSAENMIEGQGDGRISIDDSNILLKKIFDRGSITNIEYRTIFLILKNYKLTKEAYANFIDKLIQFTSK
jgi:hypothetical protein